MAAATCRLAPSWLPCSQFAGGGAQVEVDAHPRVDGGDGDRQLEQALGGLLLARYNATGRAIWLLMATVPR
jgi:hypothetical protein